jgi:hypothetical protein
MILRLFARCAFLVMALVVALWRLASHDTLLSVALIASPLAALAMAPLAALATWLGRVGLALAALVGAGLWLLHAITSRGDGHILLLGPLLAQLWCAGGIGLLLHGGCARAGGLPWWWLRLPALAAFCLAWALLVLPLTRLYRLHLGLRERDEVFAAGEIFDLPGADGVRLRCRWWSPPQPRGVMVFIHGVGGTYEDFIGVHRLFRREGWAVLDWNLRGHGHSSPAATTYGLREADDLVRVWAEARRRAPGLPEAAYGASLGASAALLAAPRLVGCDGLVLESGFAELAPLIGPSLPGALGASARLIARWGLGMDVAEVAPIAVLPDLRGLPLLIGTALGDRIIPPEHGRRLAAAAPWATHVALEDRGHMDLAYDPRWLAAVSALMHRAQAHGADGAGR